MSRIAYLHEEARGIRFSWHVPHREIAGMDELVDILVENMKSP
jgi:hypothetical protein